MTRKVYKVLRDISAKACQNGYADLPAGSYVTIEPGPCGPTEYYVERRGSIFIVRIKDLQAVPSHSEGAVEHLRDLEECMLTKQYRTDISSEMLTSLSLDTAAKSYIMAQQLVRSAWCCAYCQGMALGTDKNCPHCGMERKQ